MEQKKQLELAKANWDAQVQSIREAKQGVDNSIRGDEITTSLQKASNITSINNTYLDMFNFENQVRPYAKTYKKPRK